LNSEISSPATRRAAARAQFFLRIGQIKTVSERRCEWTGSLFPLVLILEVDGTLAADLRHLPQRVAA